MSTLRYHAHEILNKFSFPGGCILGIDGLTDNLVVTFQDRCFAITHVCLDDWDIDRILFDLRIAVDDLVQGRKSLVASIQLCEEMNMRRVSKVSFDAWR